LGRLWLQDELHLDPLPPIETFAENVGTLTRKVFGLEVTQSGFYRLLKDSANGRDFSDVLSEFNEQIGAEGRALARAFTTGGKNENDDCTGDGS
jgi:hypothetical protein